MAVSLTGSSRLQASFSLVVVGLDLTLHLNLDHLLQERIGVTMMPHQSSIADVEVLDRHASANVSEGDIHTAAANMEKVRGILCFHFLKTLICMVQIDSFC